MVTKTISKIGNSHGIIFDAALMNLARVSVGDQLTVTVHDGGSIVLTPIRPALTPEDAASLTRQIIEKNPILFERLS